jgi:hypothetical protein
MKQALPRRRRRKERRSHLRGLKAGQTNLKMR